MMNSPVTSIDLIGSEVIISTQNSTLYRCHKVIVTTSLGHLQKHHGRLFRNKIPASLESPMRNGTMTSLAKFMLEFPFRFWIKNWKRALVAHKELSMFVNNIYESVKDRGPPALVICIGPPLSIALERDNSIAWETIKPLLLAVIQPGLRDMPDPTHMWISDLSSYPWTGGSYSALKFGQNMRDLILPMMQGSWDNKLLFAGERTTIHGVRCMDGAYMSRIRAANYI